MSETHDYDTDTVQARFLTSEDVLVGESGGLSAVYDVAASTVMPGCMAVETEHGTLYLEDVLEVQILDLA